MITAISIGSLMDNHLGHRLTVEYRGNVIVLFCKDDRGIVAVEERYPTPNPDLERYAQVILHKGCAIPPKNEPRSRLHRWDECRSQRFFMSIARKHQHHLKSNGVNIAPVVKSVDAAVSKTADLEGRTSSSLVGGTK